MERLTKRTGKHSVQFKGATYRDEERYGQIYKYQMASIICAYEDTGLTPEEVIAIQKENAELKELLKLAINELKRCADDNGGCYGCKNLDLDKDECICICEEGKLLCNSVDNNMWQWQHADKLKELGVE